MSDHIPFHIQEEILERLPVKSLIKFRSVSKSWSSFIDRSHFIAAHSRHRHHQRRHLLVWYRDQRPLPPKKKYVSLNDDHTFPQQRFVQTLPLSIKRSWFPRIIGSSHGLLCLNINDSEVILWNPSIRKSIPILWPPMSSFFLSFGVCPITLDPKTVCISQRDWWCVDENHFNKHWKVMVYTLSSGKWTKISVNNNLLSKKITHTGPQVIIHRFIYWSAYYGYHRPPIRRSYDHNLIMSFDITNESFEVTDLPHNLACNPDTTTLSVSKLRDSLVIFESSKSSENQLVLVAWIMEQDDIQRSFTKLYTIEPQHESVMKVVGFRKSGQPIMEVKNKDAFKPSKLVVYEPNLNRFCDLAINGVSDAFLVNSYEETLLLFCHSDCSSYSQSDCSSYLLEKSISVALGLFCSVTYMLGTIIICTIMFAIVTY